MRFACLHIPGFPLQAALRGDAEARLGPVVLLDGTAPCFRVIAANHKAFAAGVRLGMTRVQLAEVPSLEIRHRSLAKEESTHAALMDCARAYSPQVEDTALDTVVIDLEGLHKLLGAPEQIATRLLCSAEKLGFTIQLGVAANPDAAILAARGFNGITVIQPGQEAYRLRELSIEVLPATPKVLETLHRWGIHNLTNLAALPVLQLSERLGQEGVRLQRLACGTHLRSLLIVQESLCFEEALELEDAIESLDSLAFILARLLTQLCSRLAVRGRAALELGLRLDLAKGIEPEPSLALEEVQSKHRLADAQVYESTYRLPVPMLDAKVFLKLWQLRLKNDPPSAPVRKVTVTVEHAKPRTIQGELFLPSTPDPEKLELTLARIANVVGTQNVGSFEIIDTHRPDAFRMIRFDSGQNADRDKAPKQLRRVGQDKLGRPMAFRVFRPPCLVSVELRAGRPARVFSPKVRGEVLFASGPWLTSGGWWGEEAWEREEWDVEIERRHHSRPPSLLEPSEKRNSIRQREAETTLYRLYQDSASCQWYLQGEYD